MSAVDFSDPSRRALLSGRALFPSARLTALHAYRVVPNWSGRNADRSIDVVEAEERERVVKEAERDMVDLIAVAGPGSAPIEIGVMEGEPQAVLADYGGIERTSLKYIKEASVRARRSPLDEALTPQVQF